MGLSSKKTKTKSTETVGPSAYSKPFISDAASTLRPGYEDSLAASRQYQPHLTNAANYYGDVMGGKFLDSNPYIDDIVSASNSDATDAVNSAFMPRFGSGYHAKTLARAVGENTARIRGGAYDQERAYQNEAGRNIAGTAMTATALPMLPAQGYSDAVGGLMGRYMTGNSSSQTKQSGGLAGSLLGAALSGWATGGFKL